eukprot:4877779-Ditylum_brightwellii.AAC.1
MRRSTLSFSTALSSSLKKKHNVKQIVSFSSASNTLSSSSSSVSMPFKEKATASSSSSLPTNRKWYHSTPTTPSAAPKKSSAPPPRDTRLAGRRRFYKKVGITTTSPPWEQLNEKQLAAVVESPISAGVDNTPAGATGINTHTTPSFSSMQSLLLPTQPGLTTTIADKNDTEWYGITLDGKILRTPMGTTLTLPSITLALAIAAEWDAQTTTLNPANMPLTTLACTTLDQTTLDPSIAKQSCLNFLPNDTTCYLVDPTQDRILHKKQKKAWDGLHDWCVTHHLVDKPVVVVGSGVEGLLMSRARSNTSKSVGLPHPDSVTINAKAWMETLDAWHLTALASVCSEAKSFLVGMALISSASSFSSSSSTGGKATPFAKHTAKAVEASRVEEEFQIECWGLVEGGHDYDRLNCSIQIHSAQFLCGSLIPSSSCD